MTKEEVLSGILGDACHKFFDEDSLQYVLTAMDQYYNQAIDEAIKDVGDVHDNFPNDGFIIRQVMLKLEALKKKP